MPIPDDDAARRIVRSVKATERTLRPQSKRGRRTRVLGGGGETGGGRVTVAITAASYDAATKKLTYGTGMMETFIVDAEGVDVLDGNPTKISTSVEETTPVDKNIQWKFYNGRKVVDVEPC